MQNAFFSLKTPSRLAPLFLAFPLSVFFPPTLPLPLLRPSFLSRHLRSCFHLSGFSLSINKALISIIAEKELIAFSHHHRSPSLSLPAPPFPTPSYCSSHNYLFAFEVLPDFSFSIISLDNFHQNTFDNLVKNVVQTCQSFPFSFLFVCLLVLNKRKKKKLRNEFRRLTSFIIFQTFYFFFF